MLIPFGQVVLDAQVIAQLLPGAIEAFYFIADEPPTQGGIDRPEGEIQARWAHGLFNRQYRTTVPLVKLDLNNRQAPFSLAVQPLPMTEVAITDRRACLLSDCATYDISSVRREAAYLNSLPILTKSNSDVYPEWHAYVHAVYNRAPTYPIDLNTFTFFYWCGSQSVCSY